MMTSPQAASMTDLLILLWTHHTTLFASRSIIRLKSKEVTKGEVQSVTPEDRVMLYKNYSRFLNPTKRILGEMCVNRY